MSEYKEFKAKDLDQAIETACKHFRVGREKLEIEIVSGGSGGIFGLVGKKQATVRARLRQPATGRRPVLEKPVPKPAEPTQDAPRETAPDAGQEAEQAQEQTDKPKRSRRSRGRRRSKSKAEGNGGPEAANGAPAEPRTEQQARPPQARQEARPPARREKAAPPARREQAAPPAKREQAAVPAKVETAPEAAAQTPAATSDQAPAREDTAPAQSPEELQALAKDVVARLIRPMLPELPPLEVEIEPGRIKVHIVDEEHSGLIIGHQGQTIAALQYLANRIIARQAKGNMRIHLDAGDYREKQDDNLRQLALSLADKAKSQGKMQSTRPLSSYHRRLVHMALQNDESITTRSKGEGPMKRVLILPRRERQPQQQ